MSVADGKDDTQWALRNGTKSDQLAISLTMTRNLMNPLGIDSKRFIVAVNSNNDGELYGWAQLRPIGGSEQKAAEKEQQQSSGQNQLWELASVYVMPLWRGSGIGSELVRKVMGKHAMVGRNAGDVYLLTLDSTKDWYRGLGFEVTHEPPASMKFEMVAGGIVTKFIGAELVCMRGGGGGGGCLPSD